MVMLMVTVNRTIGFATKPAVEELIFGLPWRIFSDLGSPDFGRTEDLPNLRRAAR